MSKRSMKDLGAPPAVESKKRSKATPHIPRETRGIVPTVGLDKANETIKQIKDINTRMVKLERQIKELDGIQKLHSANYTDDFHALESDFNSLRGAIMAPVVSTNPPLPTLPELEEMVKDKKLHRFKDVRTWFNQLGKYRKHGTLDSALRLIQIWQKERDSQPSKKQEPISRR